MKIFESKEAFYQKIKMKHSKSLFAERENRCDDCDMKLHSGTN